MNIKCNAPELVSIEKLVRNPKNTNKHSEKQVKALAKIIEARGWRHPVIVSKRSGFVVAGHGRLDAAELMGLSEVPVDYQDFESEADEYAFLESDNHIARYAEFDQEKMLDNLKEMDIEIESYDFEELGLLDFELPEIEVLPSEDDDVVPEVKHDPVTKRGDIWLLGVYWKCEKCSAEYGEQKAKEMNYECPCDL